MYKGSKVISVLRTPDSNKNARIHQYFAIPFSLFLFRKNYLRHIERKGELFQITLANETSHKRTPYEVVFWVIYVFYVLFCLYFFVCR